ncbi:MAG: magnesium chelatase domain-containing protein, partial [Oscillospiraceae bacterium]
EIQALVAKSSFATPRRAASGFDYNRMNLLLAVLEKRAGYCVSSLDVYINIVGGLQLDDTACDLTVCLAVVSGLIDKAISDDTIAIGEVGLGGEVRNVSNLEYRLREAQRMGFTKAIVPKHSLAQINAKDFTSLQLIGVLDIKQAIQSI